MVSHRFKRGVSGSLFTLALLASCCAFAPSASAQGLNAWLTTDASCTSSSNVVPFVPGGTVSLSLCASGAASPNLICGLTTNVVAADAFTEAVGLSIIDRQVNSAMTPSLSNGQIPLPQTILRAYSVWHDLGAAWTSNQAPGAPNLGVPIFRLTVSVPANASASSSYWLTLDASPLHQQFVVDNTPTGQPPFCNVSGLLAGQPLTATAAGALMPAFFLANAAGPDLLPVLGNLPLTGMLGMPYSGVFVVQNRGSVAASADANVAITGTPSGLSVANCTPAGLAAGASLICTLSGTPSALGTFNLRVTTLDGSDTNTSNDATQIQFVVVEPRPIAPICTASPSTAILPETVIRIECSVTGGTHNSIPGASCTPDPAPNQALTNIVCTGLAASLRSNPVITSMGPGGTAQSVVKFAFVNGAKPIPVLAFPGLWLLAVGLFGLAYVYSCRRRRD